LRVGLFVNPAEAEIEAALSAVALDILQLYVDATCAGALRARFRMLVWRSVGIATPGELPAARDGIDGFVVEPKPPDGATRPGGNAVALEWGMLSSWHAPGPWLLAGGLTQANVAEAIGRSRAPAVDVSSGVEVRPGVKDPALIRAFIAAARSAA
jgi:phosphoribosylanthranilate isomerase